MRSSRRWSTLGSPRLLHSPTIAESLNEEDDHGDHGDPTASSNCEPAAAASPLRLEVFEEGKARSQKAHGAEAAGGAAGTQNSRAGAHEKGKEEDEEGAEEVAAALLWSRLDEAALDAREAAAVEGRAQAAVELFDANATGLKASVIRKNEHTGAAVEDWGGGQGRDTWGIRSSARTNETVVREDTFSQQRSTPHSHSGSCMSCVARVTSPVVRREVEAPADPRLVALDGGRPRRAGPHPGPRAAGEIQAAQDTHLGGARAARSGF